ncbi:MAG: CDP-diacylglycerol--serine O-phosphatidyltransferase [Deltaproteobacteria bacterium]|nr:CDP-diacylglycerol--serine O-phosphatidyltransferase [Deltaproteobacteria bacterium]
MRRRLLAFNLGKAVFVLPNLFTLSSIFCGFYAIILAGQEPAPEQLYRASVAVFFGVFFDMADGRVARLTRTQSAFGVQLDSLADLGTFGVAPAVILYHWALESMGLLGVAAAFVYVACGAMRLARFNVLAARSPGPMKYFIGVPIPTAAGVLLALVMFHQRTFATPPGHVESILVLVLIVSYLMISNVRYRTFKDLRPTRKSLTIIFTLLVLFAAISAKVKPTFALLAFSWGYLTLGMLEEVIFFRRRRHEGTPPHPPADPTPPSAAPLPSPSEKRS